LNIHYPGTHRVVKNYPGSLLPGYPTGTRGSPTLDLLSTNGFGMGWVSWYASRHIRFNL